MKPLIVSKVAFWVDDLHSPSIMNTPSYVICNRNRIVLRWHFVGRRPSIVHSHSLGYGDLVALLSSLLSSQITCLAGMHASDAVVIYWFASLMN